MNGLQLGDLILDPRRVTFIPSLKAVVCSGLQQALAVGIRNGLRGVMERMDAVMGEYQPDSLIVLGPLANVSASAAVVRRWGSRSRVLFITESPGREARAAVEALGCEVHQHLAWDRYRFSESETEMALDLKAMTITGARGAESAAGAHYAVRVGSNPFGGIKLSVFLKGLGRLILPSLSPAAAALSLFQVPLQRHDVFAVGYARVLPLGKVADLKKSVRLGGLPVTKATLGAKRHGKNLV